MRYDYLKYIWPCRPVNSIPPEDLDSWDNGSMIAQLKLNGSNTLIFTNGEVVKVMGRHGQVLTNFSISKEEIISSLHEPHFKVGEWLVINGETLNKSKCDENNLVFNQKFIIFDILVCGSEYLVGKTFLERVQILDSIYGHRESEKNYLYGISENIYRVKSYKSGFSELYQKYTKIDMIEGLVMKRMNSRLELAIGEKNNWRSQIKCRKSTKNYKY